MCSNFVAGSRQSITSCPLPFCSRGKLCSWVSSTNPKNLQPFLQRAPSTTLSQSLEPKISLIALFLLPSGNGRQRLWTIKVTSRSTFRDLVAFKVFVLHIRPKRSFIVSFEQAQKRFSVVHNVVSCESKAFSTWLIDTICNLASLAFLYFNCENFFLLYGWASAHW